MGQILNFKVAKVKSNSHFGNFCYVSGCFSYWLLQCNGGNLGLLVQKAIFLDTTEGLQQKRSGSFFF